MMVTIQKGITRDVGTKFWEICDNAGVRIAEFNHDRFPHLLSGVEVYFIDLNLDGLCENVQVVADVEEKIRSATPAAGIQNNAEATLQDYVMSILLYALDRHGSERTKYLGQLREQMNAVKTDAESQGSDVSLAILKAKGIG